MPESPIHPQLMLLLQFLPPSGAAWERQQKAAWLAAIEATINVLYYAAP